MIIRTTKQQQYNNDQYENVGIPSPSNVSSNTPKTDEAGLQQAVFYLSKNMFFSLLDLGFCMW